MIYLCRHLVYIVRRCNYKSHLGTFEKESPTNWRHFIHVTLEKLDVERVLERAICGRQGVLRSPKDIFSRDLSPNMFQDTAMLKTTTEEHRLIEYLEHIDTPYLHYIGSTLLDTRLCP